MKNNLDKTKNQLWFKINFLNKLYKILVIKCNINLRLLEKNIYIFSNDLNKLVENQNKNNIKL